MVLKLLAGAGLAIPSGLNAFLPLLLMSVLAKGNKLTLHSPFDFLASWPAIVGLALLVGIEVLLNKLPQVERLDNALNLILQPLAGGLAFAAVVPPSDLPQGVSFLMGVALAEAMHLVRQDLQPALLASEMATLLKPVISLFQDGLAFLLALLAVFVPIVGGPLAILLLVVSYFSSRRFKKAMNREP